MWIRFSSFILRQRIPIIIVMGIITAFMFFQAQKVQMTYEMYNILPSNDTTYKEFQLLKDRFGQESSVLVLGMEDDALLHLENFNKWYQLCEELKRVPGVDEVLALPTIGNLKKNKEEKRFEFINLFDEKPSSQEQLDSLVDVFKHMPFTKV